MHIARTTLLALSTSIVLASACSREDRQPPVNAPPLSTQPTSAPLSDTNGNPGRTTETPGANGDGDTTRLDTGLGTSVPSLALSDGQIADTTKVINEGERDQAKYAVDHATDPSVKQFAQMMLDDHTKALGEIKSTVDKDDLVTKDSDLATSIHKSANQTFDDLKSRKKGADFDKAYMDAQIKEHQDALDALDTKLLPASKSPDLKSLLTSMRDTVATHLDHAKMVRNDLK